MRRMVCLLNIVSFLTSSFCVCFCVHSHIVLSVWLSMKQYSNILERTFKRPLEPLKKWSTKWYILFNNTDFFSIWYSDNFWRNQWLGKSRFEIHDIKFLSDDYHFENGLSQDFFWVAVKILALKNMVSF